jgi:hydrogenase maturation protein HypF
VRGLVQGVGFRPTVWRLAQAHGLWGEVSNDGEGVLIRIWGSLEAMESFIGALPSQAPPLARIEAIERQPLTDPPPTVGFRILASGSGPVHTGVVPDAATCSHCRAEIFSPACRHYRYPFTNCTHCGPRFSILKGIPYDRAQTSMVVFAMCVACQAEYEDPAQRRFHAQPNACPRCGPQVWLEAAEEGKPLPAGAADCDPIRATVRLLRNGAIVAIKGIGGFHLACLATDGDAVARLRAGKHRLQKPLALMARDLTMIRRYCRVSPDAERLLQSPAAPIVLLPLAGRAQVAANVAGGQQNLGFMLPSAPLYHLLFAELAQPLVMTSGNRAEEPPCLDNATARKRLGGVAEFFLWHNREIVNRVDDSVARIMAGQPRLLRRARGYAPTPLLLPPGFEDAPPLLALGGELKNTFCLLQQGQGIVSQHLGDLEEARTFAEYQQNLALYSRLYQHTPTQLVIDRHPEYLSAKLGRAWAAREDLPLLEVQHHHAHIASCMAENGLPLTTPPVLGVALDGLGYGEDGTLWGGELLRADYHGFVRLATFKPVALIGGVQAIREPWRSLYAHLQVGGGWENFRRAYGDLALIQSLQTKPLPVLAAMLAQGINCPQTSACGRLFDAVAAALGVQREAVHFEGQAAMALEACIEETDLSSARRQPYPFAFTRDSLSGLSCLDPAPLWPVIFADLQRGMDPGNIAARFHLGLVEALVSLIKRLGKAEGISTVALSGGVFQNRILLEEMFSKLQHAGFTVLLQQHLPSNDGGLSFGQAVIGAAWALRQSKAYP